MSYFALVTVDARGCLTRDSVVTVYDEATNGELARAEVPERTDRAGVLFWPRVGDALVRIGWRKPQRGWINHAGCVEFDVEAVST